MLRTIFIRLCLLGSIAIAALSLFLAVCFLIGGGNYLIAALFAANLAGYANCAHTIDRYSV